MGKRVMVVEDEKAIREILQWALENANYEVVVAQDGLDALEKMQSAIPDLIVLDLAMPRMNGLHFVEELDRQGMRSTIPIIVLTAHGRIEDTSNLHVDAFIRKPFHILPLLDMISQLLQIPQY